MKTVRFTIAINAPVEFVWDTMPEEETFRQRTIALMKGSHYTGSQKKGSRIEFLQFMEERRPKALDKLRALCE